MEGNYISALSKSKTASVRKSDIIYVENQSGIVVICTSQCKYRYRGKINSLIESLDTPFYRCHSNLIVNFDKLRSAKGNVLHMDGGTVLFLGRNAYQATRRDFGKYLIENCGLREGIT
jgi:DNA-binding LytR/AlgR family response regulator